MNALTNATAGLREATEMAERQYSLMHNYMDEHRRLSYGSHEVAEQAAHARWMAGRAEEAVGEYVAAAEKWAEMVRRLIDSGEYGADDIDEAEDALGMAKEMIGG